LLCGDHVGTMCSVYGASRAIAHRFAANLSLAVCAAFSIVLA